MFERLDPGGERHKMANFYRCARSFDPNYARTLDYEDASLLIKGLRAYKPLDDDDNILMLLETFDRFKHRASNVSNVSSEVNVLQWHYDFCHADELDENDNLKTWYYACELVALVQPSSGASKKAFSLLKQLWGDQQTSSFSDAIIVFTNFILNSFSFFLL